MLACVTDHKPAGNARGTRRWVLAWSAISRAKERAENSPAGYARRPLAKLHANGRRGADLHPGAAMLVTVGSNLACDGTRHLC